MPRGAGPRAVVAFLFVVLIALVAVRSAAGRTGGHGVIAGIDRLLPTVASRSNALMLASARAARDGDALSDAERDNMERLLRAAPLAIEPLLVAGAIAQIDGRLDRAEASYDQARYRDPRAPAARLLLADLQLRRGAVDEGLRNLVALVRLAPEASQQVPAALAQYAGSPGGTARLRSVLRQDPELRRAVLTQLASDIRTIPQAISIAGAATPKASPEIEPWQAQVIATYFGAGRFAEAKKAWSRFAGVPGAGSILNPRFRPSGEPAPFGWSTMSGPAGVAEIRPRGGLSLLFFGREPFEALRQVTMMGPGRRTLVVDLDRAPGLENFRWRIVCLSAGGPSPEPVAVLPIIGGSFEIPANCPAQQLTLIAQPGEVERTVSTVVHSVEGRGQRP